MERRRDFRKLFHFSFKKDAVLIFKNIDESKTKELIEILPYFPYMQK